MQFGRILPQFDYTHFLVFAVICAFKVSGVPKSLSDEYHSSFVYIFFTMRLVTLFSRLLRSKHMNTHVFLRLAFLFGCKIFSTFIILQDTHSVNHGVFLKYIFFI